MNQAVVNFINRTFASRASKSRYGMMEMHLIKESEQGDLNVDYLHDTTIEGHFCRVMEVRYGIARFKGHMNMFKPSMMQVINGERASQVGHDILLTATRHWQGAEQDVDNPGLTWIHGYRGKTIQLHSAYGSDLRDLRDASTNDWVEIECSLILRRAEDREGYYWDTVNFDQRTHKIYESLGFPTHTKKDLGLPENSTDCYHGVIDKAHVGGMTVAAEKEWQQKVRQFQKGGVELLDSLMAA